MFGLVNDIQLLLPLVFVGLSVTGLLVYGSVVATDGRRGFPVLRDSMRGLTLAVLFVGLLLSVSRFDGGYRLRLMEGRFILDDVTIGGWCVLIARFSLIVVGMRASLSSWKIHAFEFTLLLLLAWVGMGVLVAGRSLLTLYLGLELQALGFYVLRAMRRGSSYSTEAALKYFLLGAFRSGVLLFGMSLIYLDSGRLQYDDLRRYYWCVQDSCDGDFRSKRIVGCLMILVALLFKMGAAPFHMWVPDVYEGRATPVSAFFATVPKFGLLVVLLRLCYRPFGALVEYWRALLLFAAMLSMVIGTFGALRQRKTKRFLAYRSIRHRGYLLLAVSTGTVEGVRAAFLYVMVYVLMGTLLWVSLLGLNGAYYIRDLKGLGKYNVSFAFVIALGMLSMAGIPPLMGFLSKGLALMSALERGYYLPSVLAVLLAVVSAFYYLRWLKVMFFDAVRIDRLDEVCEVSLRRGQSLILSGLRVGLVALLVYPDPLLVWSQRLALGLVA